jgi:hypothetical protein
LRFVLLKTTALEGAVAAVKFNGLLVIQATIEKLESGSKVFPLIESITALPSCLTDKSPVELICEEDRQ